MSWPRFPHPIFTLGFPTGKRLRQCRRSARAVKPREAWHRFTHLQWPSPPTKDWQESCWLRKVQNPNNVFFVGSPACYKFSLLYWWILMTSIGRQLVIKWSSSGHSHIWSSCLYRVLMLIFFTLPAFFFPAVYLLGSTPVGFNMSQLPGTKISKASPTCCGRAKAGGPTPRPPWGGSRGNSSSPCLSAHLQQFVKLQRQGRADSAWHGASPHPISWSGPWYQNLPYTVPSWMT